MCSLDHYLFSRTRPCSQEGPPFTLLTRHVFPLGNHSRKKEEKELELPLTVWQDHTFTHILTFNPHNDLFIDDKA